MNHYLIRYSPCRDTFLEDSSDEEQAIIGQHFLYLQSLLEQEKLLIAGRTDDAEVGIAVITAADEKEAETILHNDPAVKGKVFVGSVKLFRLALMQEKT